MAVVPVLTELSLAASAEAWSKLGFAVGSGGVVGIGATAILLTPGGGRGLCAWGFAEPLPGSLDGIPTRVAEPRPPGPEHPNGATRLDHVVIATPDLARTRAAFAAAGLAERREREAGALRQVFYRAGEVVLELVGPGAATGTEPARLWGLVAVVPDLDALAARLGPALGAPRDAVQPGRRIATAGREAGAGTRLAFMTP